ncbi:PolyA RNA polymerase cid14 [Gigaspora margarita]|uniref:polynucleotide adenylyltransferase n=1 Tax=Gigaspora margarita TaxID=4874 RepID=A0A8H4AGA7_GIGMA|nr:PolyA RNA polymerase cid14 [Gigaspora margarita]
MERTSGRCPPQGPSSYQPFSQQLPVSFRLPPIPVHARVNKTVLGSTEIVQKTSVGNAFVNNDPFIPLNPLTVEEIRVFEDKKAAENNARKRRRSSDYDKWRRPNSQETPWINNERTVYKSVVQRLHYEILEFVDYLLPTNLERLLRGYVIKRIEMAIRAVYPTAEIMAFGSYNTGLYLPTSDIDLVCFIHQRSPLREIVAILNRNNICEGRPVAIANAVVPIIKFKERYTKFNVDLSFNQASGFSSAAAMKLFMKEWPSLGKLVVTLKYFLHHHELDDPSCGGMGGYTVFCMILSFLQLHPEIQKGLIIPEDENLGVLLIEFFELYGIHYNYEDLAIRVAKDKSSGFNIGYYRKKYEDWTMKDPITNICIQDPSDSTNDIARSTKNMRTIRGEFWRAFQRLVTRVGYLERCSPRDEDGTLKDLQNQSILSSIVYISSDVRKRRDQLYKDYKHGTLGTVLSTYGTDPSLFVRHRDVDDIIGMFKFEIAEADRLRTFKFARIRSKNDRRYISSPSNRRERSPVFNYRTSTSIDQIYVEENSDMEMSDEYISDFTSIDRKFKNGTGDFNGKRRSNKRHKRDRGD